MKFSAAVVFIQFLIVGYAIVLASEQSVPQQDVNVKSDDLLTAAAAYLILGLVQGDVINEKNLKQTVDFLVQHYDKNSLAMVCLGSALGILFLRDSLNDVHDVQRLSNQVATTLKAHYRQDITPAYTMQRFGEIRREIETLKNRQVIMGGIKFISAAIFGTIAVASNAGFMAKSVTFATAGMCTTAAIINGVNYYNLNNLIARLTIDGYLS